MSAERRPSELARLEEIRRVGLERTAEVAAVLGEAFAEDPLLGWILRDAVSADLAARRAAWWSFMIRHAPPGTEVHVTGDGAGAAVWHPPGAGKAPAAVVAAFRDMVSGVAGHRRAGEVLAGFARVAARAPARPHWHLAALGVRPDRWGEGLGARLAAPMLARCDRLGLPAYLESSNPRNRRFYERLGFTDRGEVSPGGGVRLTLMWRRADPGQEPSGA